MKFTRGKPLQLYDIFMRNFQLSGQNLCCDFWLLLPETIDALGENLILKYRASRDF